MQTFTQKFLEGANKAPNFASIKKQLTAMGFIPNTCREQGPYYYSANGATERERSPGLVAYAVRKLAVSHGLVERFSPEATMQPCGGWDGKWPRTQRSWMTEQQGAERFWSMVESLISKGVLTA